MSTNKVTPLQMLNWRRYQNIGRIEACRRNLELLCKCLEEDDKRKGALLKKELNDLCDNMRLIFDELYLSQKGELHENSKPINSKR